MRKMVRLLLCCALVIPTANQPQLRFARAIEGIQFFRAMALGENDTLDVCAISELFGADGRVQLQGVKAKPVRFATKAACTGSVDDEGFTGAILQSVRIAGDTLVFTGTSRRRATRLLEEYHVVSDPAAMRPYVQYRIVRYVLH